MTAFSKYFPKPFLSRPRPVDYLRRLNAHLKEGDLASALKIHDEEMRDELVRPKDKHYRVLIRMCAKAGYTKKAFQLYAEYRSRYAKDSLL